MAREQQAEAAKSTPPSPPTSRSWAMAGEKLLKTKREEIVRGFGLLLSTMQKHEEVLKRLLRAQPWDNSG